MGKNCCTSKKDEYDSSFRPEKKGSMANMITEQTDMGDHERSIVSNPVTDFKLKGSTDGATDRDTYIPSNANHQTFDYQDDMSRFSSMNIAIADTTHHESILVGESINHDDVFHQCCMKILNTEVLRDAGCNPFIGGNLKKIQEAQFMAIPLILKNDFYTKSAEVSTVEGAAKAKQEQIVSNMKSVNQFNWQYMILQKGDKLTPINDYESMMIGLEMRSIKSDPTTKKLLPLVTLNMKINLYSSVVYTKDKRYKVMKKASENNRSERARPVASEKAFEISLIPKKDGFAPDMGAFGIEWATVFKKDHNACPSFNEMMEQLFQWYHQQTLFDQKGKSKQEQESVHKYNKKCFNEFIKSVKFEDPNKPFNIDENDDEYGLFNPYSKATAVVLQLYSMEFGAPPLYAALNTACRDVDTSKLPILGGYAQCLTMITAAAEKRRKASDKIMTGDEIKKTMGGGDFNLAGSFLLFRGAQMKDEWIKPYMESNTFEHKNKDGDPLTVFLPGNTSFSQDLSVALGFATANPREGCFPVLFVLSCHNWFSPPGVRMNNEAYTAYPEECEYLMMEGTEVQVFGVQKGLNIKNPYTAWRKYNGMELTIVHLYNL